MSTTMCRILWMPVNWPRAAGAREGRKSKAATAATSTTRLTAAILRQRRDDDLAVARPVELAEEDPLPAAERELPVLQRDEDLRARERGAHVRRRVRPVRIL